VEPKSRRNVSSSDDTATKGACRLLVHSVPADSIPYVSPLFHFTVEQPPKKRKEEGKIGNIVTFGLGCR